MPWSSDEGKDWMRRHVVALNPGTVLDVGCGAGAYADLLRPLLPEAKFTAIEVHEPYIERFGLVAKYDRLIVGDVRDLEFGSEDVVIFGDVLEHLAVADAVAVWERARAAAWLGVFASLPIIEWPQGPVDGNRHEAHLHAWSHDQVLAILGGVEEWWCGSAIGAYFAKPSMAAQ